MALFRRKQIEERAADSYTDTLVSILVSGAEGKIAKATATAVLEACAGLVGRASASARVEGPDLVASAFGPRLRSMVGRSLVRSGEAVLFIDIGGGRLALHPAGDWDIEGSYDPETWRYRLSLAGSSLQATRPVRRERTCCTSAGPPIRAGRGGVWVPSRPRRWPGDCRPSW